MLVVKSCRSRVRKCQELVTSARIIGDRDAQAEAEKELIEAKRALATALVKEYKDGVSKADEPAGKPKGVPSR